LQDVRVSAKTKVKIRQIMAYKKYFYNFFHLTPKPIYNRTFILSQRAVTYLVIGSPKSQIKAIKHCFPIVGCFPYLGFFSEKKADEYVRILQSQGLATWKRDVYAYSTLGYFNDPILSSFFYYDEFQLAELVFHELFHTIFFVKGEVELNENLANFFAEKLVKIYFHNRPDDLYRFKTKKVFQNRVNQKIIELAYRLQEKYRNAVDRDYSKVLKHFLHNEFQKDIYSLCAKFNQAECKIAEGTWNNARFAAFKTYEAKRYELNKLFNQLQLDLVQFFHYINEKYKQFDEQQRGSFEAYLFNRSLRKISN
jgi:predicted aminopeptidase